MLEMKLSRMNCGENSITIIEPQDVSIAGRCNPEQA